MVKVSKAAVAVEGKGFPVYRGVAHAYVMAVNEPMVKVKELGFNMITKEPEYITVDNEGVKIARITFYLRCESSDGKLRFNYPMTFLIQQKPVVGKTSGKTQIIDKYGRTAWATPEDIAAKRIPVYPSGPANIDSMYRPCYVGEENLVNFIKAWVNIQPVVTYKDGAWVPSKAFEEDPESCEAILNMKNIFAGDFSEIKALVPAAIDHYVKCAAGSRMNDGRMYQAVYSRAFLKSSQAVGFNTFTEKNDALTREIQEVNTSEYSQANGVIYETCALYDASETVTASDPVEALGTFEKNDTTTTTTTNIDDDLPF